MFDITLCLTSALKKLSFLNFLRKKQKMTLFKRLILGAILLTTCFCTTPYIFRKMYSSRSITYALRLRPNEDLKQQLMAFAKANDLRAAYVITCVGSLKQAHIRFANQPKGTVLTEKFEITSLVGAFNTEGGAFSHLAR
jgi:hypothetical protein